MTWRILLSELIDTGTYRSQRDLSAALAAEGHQVSQATLSRHLVALGVRKRGGFYRQAPAAELPAPIHAVEVATGGGIAVVRTSPAHASVVAHVIDAAQLPGVLGTVAGDDTVFVALARADAAQGLRRMLGLAAQHHAEAKKEQGGD